MSLLEWRCPSDVAGNVVSVRVNSVERHSGRAVSDRLQNVFQKCFEIVFPSFQHDDADSSITPECNVVRVVTSLLDRLPRVVYPGSWTFRRIAVLPCIGVAKFGTRAATGRVAASKPSDAADTLFPAIAAAEPMRAAFFHVREANSGEIPEALSCNIEFTHSGSSSELLCQGRRRTGSTRRPAYFTINCGVL